jgi:poly-gamma-glutamate capsule biosynthesis protein CapA/YwtB (metallophosphatase superfamily)
MGSMKIARPTLLLIVAVMPCAAQPDPSTQIPRVPIPCTIQDGFTLAAVGDLIGPGRPQLALANPGLGAVVKILKQADHGFANQEGSIFDFENFKGSPAAENGGGIPLGIPAVALDLRNMGIDMMSKANNHATDWGLDGLAATERVLDQAGIAHAGSGRNRAAARAAAFLETSKGRIALVAAASTFTPMSVAGSVGAEVAGRPGISVLRTRRVTLVTATEMAALKTIAARQGRTPGAETKEITLNGQDYRASEKPGLTYEMNPYDQFEILRSIRAAKEVSSLVVFSIHAHETASGDPDARQPADFLPIFFHHAIDAGADIVVTHGPHVLHGVEIYKGKPIFYGLASFFFEMELGHVTNPDNLEEINLDMTPLTYPEYVRSRFPGFPRDWFDSVVAVSEFRGGQVREIRLYPLTLTRDRGPIPHPQGMPKPATGDDARRILAELERDSAPFGTKITIENNVGIIKVPPLAN